LSSFELRETSPAVIRLHGTMDDPRAPSAAATDATAVDGAVVVVAIDRRAALENAFEAHHQELLSFLRRATRDDQTAEDLAQEAFLRLAREVDAGRTPQHLRAWLYRVASNLVVSRARRANTVVDWLRRHGPAAIADDRAPSPEEGLLRRERQTELELLLDALPADARTALLLSGQGFTGLEIAAAIGRSHAATRTLLTRTRINLRLALEAREGGQ
jgi:RNA polymerase sigma-70 factor (ECF subfamily)